MPSYKIASRADVKAAAKKLPEEFVTCRDVGHTWRQFRIARIRGGYNRDLFCPTCKTNRHEFITRTGEKMSVGYTYPKGYQFSGMGRILGDARNAIRLESVVRALDTAVEATGTDMQAGTYDETTGQPIVREVPVVRVQAVDQEAMADR